MPIQDALAIAARINKKLGAEALVLGSQMVVPKRFTSGSLSVDLALGGGWPGNKWVEIIGAESHGKTAMVFKTVAANQRLDPDFTTLWLASEDYDAEHAASLGVDNDRIILFPTQDMEEAYQIILEYTESRSVDCIVLDSYPALIPNDEDQKDMQGLTVGSGAKVTARFIRKAGKAGRRSLTSLDDRPFLGIVINQWRDEIGGFAPFGTPKITPGGKAKNYFYWLRIEVKRDEWIDMPTAGKGKVRVGQVMKVRTIKNKSAAPHKIATVDFYFADAPGLGFSKGDYDVAKDICSMALLYDVVERRGSTYVYANRKWVGKDALFNAVRGELDLQEELFDVVLERSKVTPTDTEPVGAAA